MNWLNDPVTWADWLISPLVGLGLWILWKLLTDNTKWGD